MKKIFVKDKLLTFRYFFTPIHLLNSPKLNDRDVLEINITDENLILVYKTKEVVIRLSDIESVNARLNANYIEKHSYITLSCETIVTIKTYRNGTITFSDTPIVPMSYDFMLRLLRDSFSLPNFTYCVVGNANVAKEDVKHFARYGKRLPLSKKMQLDKIYSIKIICILLFISLLICFCIPVYIVRHNEYEMEQKNYQYKYKMEQHKKIYDKYLLDYGK